MRPATARPAVALALLAGCLLALPAAAGVYLNGVRIDGAVRDQVIEKATVRIDAKGDVYIEAPGYAVRTEPVVPAQAGTAGPSVPAAQAVQPAPAAAAPPPSAEAPARITRRYLLVTQQPVVGAAAYDVDLFLNGRWVRRLRSAEQQVVMDLTAQLVPGRNTVQLAARKLPKELRSSDEAAHVFRVLIGEGSAGKGDVVLERPLVTFTRSAAEDRDVTEQFTITTR